MASLFRFRSCFNKDLLNLNRSGVVSSFRPVTLKAQPQQATLENENHDMRNMNLKRPMSPHLTIYAPQLTSMLSITHRMTGVALAGYTVMFGMGVIILPESIPHYIEAMHSGGVLHLIGKFFLAFPFSYHFWNGIRHLLWDTGRFLSIREVYTTGYVMLVLSIASTLGLCLM